MGTAGAQFNIAREGTDAILTRFFARHREYSTAISRNCGLPRYNFASYYAAV